jgi:hypothetical protein
MICLLIQRRSSLLVPPLLLPSLAFVHRRGLQLIHDPRAHLHHAVSMAE